MCPHHHHLKKTRTKPVHRKESNGHKVSKTFKKKLNKKYDHRNFVDGSWPLGCFRMAWSSETFCRTGDDGVRFITVGILAAVCLARCGTINGLRCHPYEEKEKSNNHNRIQSRPYLFSDLTQHKILPSLTTVKL